MPTFKALGDDLANIVCDFAFLTTYHDVFNSLKSFLMIDRLMSPVHYCGTVFFHPSTSGSSTIRLVFEPISCFEGYRSIFDWNEIYCRLWQLDFRRSVVRSFGSRGRWHLRLTLTWTTALDFVLYYRALQITSGTIYKPTLIGLPLRME